MLAMMRPSQPNPKQGCEEIVMEKFEKDGKDQNLWKRPDMLISITFQKVTGNQNRIKELQILLQTHS